jgi:nucleotide-binding universal stress UspA family protein
MRATLPKKPRLARRHIYAPPESGIQNILATTDLSNGSLAGVRYAVALAGKVGARVALLHVIEIPPVPPMPGLRTVSLLQEDSKMVKRARVRLKTLARRETQGDLNLTPVLRSGNSYYGIITTARERQADLIVIATHGYTGVKRVLLGNTTERVVRHAPCQVLTVPVRKTPERLKMRRLELKKILVPIDFSKTSETALPWAALFAVEFDAAIILLHVVETFPTDYMLGRELMNETITPLMKQRESELQHMAEDLGKSTGMKASAVVRHGKPFKEICGAAQKLGADLITMTSRGLTGFKHVWLGSTAERVVRHAPCPVLTVRRPGSMVVL